MIFNETVPDIDRRRITEALSNIKKFGDKFQQKIAEFIEDTEIVINLDTASKVGGSGSVQLDDQKAAISAVQKGDLGFSEAAKFVRLNIARETIDTGGQRGIEGTFIHEGKHALDFALMLSSFSKGVERKIFNPTAFQRELSAHLTSAFYLKRRGGEFMDEGISLGLLYYDNGKIKVNRRGILDRLKNSYGLTKENPGGLLNTAAYPAISVPGKKWFGLF